MAEPRDDDKPQYTLYRARPKFLRRRSDDGGLREMQQEPARRTRRRRPSRAAAGAGARAGGSASGGSSAGSSPRWSRGCSISLVLFLVSAQIQSANVSDAATPNSAAAATR